MQYYPILDYLFIAVIILVGIASSFYDYKFSKIPNRLIFISLILAGFLYAVKSAVLLRNSEHKLLFEVIINILLLGVLSFLLFRFRLLSAGDAKLLFTMGILIPQEFYSNNHISYFPSLVFVFNSFTISAFLMLVLSFLSSKSSFPKIKINTSQFLLVSLSSVLALFALSGFLMRLSILFFPSYNLLYLTYLLAFLLHRAMLYFARAKMIYLYILHSVYGLVFLLQIFILGPVQSNIINNLIFAIIFSVLFNLMFSVVILSFSGSSITKLSPKELKPGMALHQDFYTKKSASAVLKEGCSLSDSDITFIRKHAGKQTVFIKSYSSFAIFIFLSAVFTILTKSEFVSFIFRLVSIL